MPRGKEPLLRNRTLIAFRASETEKEAAERLAEFLGVEVTEVYELGLRRLFADVNAEVSSLLEVLSSEL